MLYFVTVRLIEAQAVAIDFGNLQRCFKRSSHYRVVVCGVFNVDDLGQGLIRTRHQVYSLPLHIQVKRIVILLFSAGRW